jgi:hypothetical protein
MNFRPIIVALWILVAVCTVPLASQAAVVGGNAADPLCEEETVYGTVVLLDEDLGVFGLLGTRYKFQSMEMLDIAFLQGRMVRIDIGSDCGILDLRVLDGDSEAII